MPGTSYPTTQRRYLNDTYLYDISSTILAVEPMPPDTSAGSNKMPYFGLVIAETVFHPQGGGQPSDVGRVVGENGVTFFVDNVRVGENAIIYHYGTFQHEMSENEDGARCIPFRAGEKVKLEIDAARRRLHARLHSAGHALDVAVLRLGFELRPTKGYHFEDHPFVEYLGKLPADKGSSERLIEALTLKIQELIEEDIATELYSTSKAEAASILSGGVNDVAHFPEGAQVRLVSVGGNICPCGGTHVKSTKELRGVEITRIKTKKNVTKISYRISKEGKERQIS